MGDEDKGFNFHEYSFSGSLPVYIPKSDSNTTEISNEYILKNEENNSRWKIKMEGTKMQFLYSSDSGSTYAVKYNFSPES